MAFLLTRSSPLVSGLRCRVRPTASKMQRTTAKRSLWEPSYRHAYKRVPLNGFTTIAAGVHSGVSTIAPSRAVGFWLLGVAGAVYGMVVLGGVTRLTRSGLSMVDWRPQGKLPPRSEEEWLEEFAKYKQFPEYKRVNIGLTLSEFKEIYYMEWAHRMWGRALGIIYVLPLLYFVGTRQTIKIKGMTPKLLGLAGLGGAQGLVGWWMVKSGLEESTILHEEPRVSPYRLTAHLTAATVLYTGLIWTGLTALNPTRLVNPSAAVQMMRRATAVGALFTGVTFLSGAFVAGNDAGHAYNDWPLYAGDIIPKEIWDDKLVPAYRNFFENTATVQFDHRNLAYATACVVLSIVSIGRSKAVWGNLPSATQKGLYAMGLALVAQVTLGISTLMLFVPVPLAAMHQGGALLLWTTVVYGQHSLRYLRV